MVVRLVVQVLAADRAETGAVGAAEDLVRQLERERVARPGGEVELVVLDVGRPQLFVLGIVRVVFPAEIGRSSTASSRQRKQGPCRRTWKASSKTVPVDARVIVSSAGTFSGTGR